MFVQIEEIDAVGSMPNELVWGCLDIPGAPQRQDSQLHIEGWAVGCRAEAVLVHVRIGDRTLCTRPIDRERPDVTSLEQFRSAHTPGFLVVLSPLQIPTAFDLSLEVELNDGSSVRLATLKGVRSGVPSGGKEDVLPLAVTCGGRTGSTWLLHVLGMLPNVFVHRQFQSEARIASYWAEVFQGLVSPASLKELVEGSWGTPYWWLGSDDLERPLPEEIATWASTDHAAAVSDFCRDRIESHYRALGASGHTFFAEKMLPGDAVLALNELYPHMREIILVRDFRDTVSSVLAFNEKRGFASFHRDRVTSDADFIRLMAKSAGTFLAWWHARRDKALLVRYEDLIDHERETLREIVRHLAIADEDDEGVLSQVMAKSHMELPEMALHRTASSVGASIGRWRSDLSPDLQELAQEAFATSLSGFGYELED